MAQHFWRLPPRTLEDGLILLAGYVDVGASGAVTTTIFGGTNGVFKGITSFVHTSTGLYTITLDQPYWDLRGLSVEFLSATAQDIQPQLQSYNLASTSQTVVFRTLTGVTPTDPSSGTRMFVTLILKNSQTF